MNTGFYTNPIFLEHDTGSHPENANRLRAITDKLESEGMLKKLKKLEEEIDFEDDSA